VREELAPARYVTHHLTLPDLSDLAAEMREPKEPSLGVQSIAGAGGNLLLRSQASLSSPLQWLRCVIHDQEQWHLRQSPVKYRERVWSGK
jgi:hypothetical protein